MRAADRTLHQELSAVDLVDHQRGNPVASRHDGQREHVLVEHDRPVQVAQIQQRGLNAEPHLRHPFGGPAEVGGGAGLKRGAAVMQPPGGQPADIDIQRDVPPMVARRGARQPDLAE
jgi:hypothetical protein